MKSKVKFGQWEAIALSMNIICMQIYLSFPRIMAESAGTAAWIQTLYVSFIAIGAFVIISKLYVRMEGKDIIDICEYVGGGIGRVILGSIYALYTLGFMTIVLREFAENMKTVALPNSPLSFIILLFLVCVVISAYMGLESIVRFNALLSPVAIAGFIVIVIGVSSYYQFSNITPLLGKGWYTIFVTGAPRVSIYSGMIMFLILSPFIGGHKMFSKVGYITLIASAIALTLGCLSYTLVYSYPGSTQSFLPIYSLARQIYFGRFFQRVEAVFLFTWAAVGILYLSTVFFITLNFIMKTFKLKYYKPLIFPLAVIVFTLSLFPQSLMSTIKIEGDYMRQYIWIVSIALPIVLLSIGNMKKRGRKKEASNK